MDRCIESMPWLSTNTGSTGRDPLARSTIANRASQIHIPKITKYQRLTF